jgi:hypothetical protein
MTIASAPELIFLKRLLQSSRENFSSPNGAGIMDLLVSFAFRSSYRWMQR